MATATAQRPKTNEFFDINKFPAEPGITVLGVSMPLISNRQNPAKCFEATRHLVSKIKESGVGAAIVYSDGLYMYSQEPASALKLKFQKLMEEHKQGYLNLIKTDINIIPRAFSFITWSQLLLDCKNFSNYLNDLKKFYEKDAHFKELITADIASSGREESEDSLGYLLEEVLVDYLVAKGAVRLQNDYVEDRQKWVLNCYHGKPHRAHAYLHQKNLFDLQNDENPYQNGWYDLAEKKLYDFDRMDIDSFDFSKTENWGG